MGLTEFQDLISLFRHRYSKIPRLFYAPGRVNLIGEHTDYNNGFVLPFAIDRGTTVAAASRPDRVVQVYSMNLGESTVFDLDTASALNRGMWFGYVEGMMRSLQGFGLSVSGADLLISSEVPIGAGLSSSAALEVAIGIAVCGISAEPVDTLTLVKAAHQTETMYIGTQSGPMDQYVAVEGRRDSCVLLDCRSLESRLVPLKLHEFAILISDTGVKRALSSSGYNQRRVECQEGVSFIQRLLPHVHSLRDLTLAELTELETTLPPIIYRRCRHVVTENQRTLAAAEALQVGNLGLLGALMFESHESLRVDFEVTIPQLDLLVDTARGFQGILGARMTGGGFGGCTITLLERAALADFEALADAVFREAFGVNPTFVVATPGDGAHEVIP
jgi:galactokinase